MTENKEVRVRFAPSPTGFFHIGSARTALFNYLFAKKNKGKVILRIEDTDKERSKKEYEDDIMRSIEWLGLSWDEGPYRQSERSQIYKKYLLRLLEEKKAYYCFCNKERLEEMRAGQRERKEPPRYDGKCYSLKEGDVKDKLKEKESFTIRLKIPEDEVLEFDDKVRGKVKFFAKDIGGDFVIAKEDFSCLYNFVCAIDDYEMKISHIIRGEDHISNTPKQILVQKALGFPIPEFAHISLILGSDKSKLSKRHGAASVYEYKEKGYLPDALVNFIALLGWHPGGEEEMFTLSEIIDKFSLQDCQKSGAVFDLKKLDYINGHYIRRMDVEKLTSMCMPYLINAGYIRASFKETQYPPAYGGMAPEASYHAQEGKISFSRITQIVSLYQERLKFLSEVEDLLDYFFKNDINYEKELLFWKGNTEEKTLYELERCFDILSSVKNWEKSTIEKELLEEANKEKDRGRILWPLRVALTGKKASAGPFDVAWVLGREKTLKRLKTAIDTLKK